MNHKVFEYNQIDDLIYLGSNLCCTMPSHVQILMNLGVSADIDLEIERQELTPMIDSYLWLPVKDHFAPSPEQLDMGVAAIDSLIKNHKKIYIHCKNGHGRSPTLLAAYYIFKGMSLEQALETIKNKRPEIHMGDEQISALKQFAKKY